MRSDPRIWIKIKEIDQHQPLDRAAFEVLKTHMAALAQAGIEILSGHQRDWALGIPGFPRDWLSCDYEQFNPCSFAIVGVLVYGKCLREAHRTGPAQVELVKTHIGALIAAGVPVGGGEHGVERIFANAAQFHEWADGPPREFPVRTPAAPFSPYPRQ